ncbi:MAG: phosphomethylpyrimidine synthase, partial [Paracoccaceae bacterium]
MPSSTEYQFLSETAKVDHGSIQPFPASRKIHVEGSDKSIRVAMREIQLTPTPIAGADGETRMEPNLPVRVYDTSGPYTDPETEIDIRKGLAPLREAWIERRGD